MFTRMLIAMTVAFCLGWLASTAGTQIPIVERAQETIAIFDAPGDVPSPADVVQDRQIHVLPDRIEIDIAGAVPAVFTDTNSMDPVIDIGTTALELPITRMDEVQVGDIVSFVTPLAPGATIIHRVVEKGSDEDGPWIRTAGDNSGVTDPGLVRESQLRRKVIGLLY